MNLDVSQKLRVRGTHRAFRAALMLAFVMVSMAGFVSAQTIPQIGLKFGLSANGGNQSTNAAAGALAPTDLAGFFPQTNWNDLGRFGDNTGSFSIVDSTGVTNAVIVNWDANNIFAQAGGGNPTAQSSPDGNVMNSFLDATGAVNVPLANTVFGNSVSNKPLVYISGLSNWLASHSLTYYDVVLYADGDATAGRTGEYWLMNASGPTSGLTFGSDITTHQFICDRFNFLNDSTYRQMPPTITNGFVAEYGGFDGNFTVFKGLTNDSFLVRTEEFRNGGTLRSPINAIQIVPRTVPVVATIDPIFPQTVFAGAKAVFRATVAGVTPMTFQWQKGGVNLSDGGKFSGSQTAALTITNVAAGDAGAYNVIVSNSVGTLSSSVATLTVTTPIPGSYAEKVFTNNPVAYWRLNESADPSTNFAAAQDYVGGLTGAYQFQAQNGFNGIIGPQPSAGYPGFESANSALYSGGAGATTSANTLAHSWVTAPPLGLNTNTATFMAWIFPTAQAEPGSAGIIWTRNNSGNNDTGGLDYQNNNHIGYTWNGQSGTFNFGTGPIVPSNTWSLVAAVITPSNAVLYCYNTNGQFSATNTFTNAPQGFNGVTLIGDDPSSLTTPQNRAFIGMIDEAAVFNFPLTGTQINDFFKKGLGLTAILPVIGSQPLPEALYAGRTASFTVTASGDQPLSYQWRSNGVNLTTNANIPSVTSPTLIVSNVTLASAANYDVVVANLAGFATSSVANLQVITPPATFTPYEAKLQADNPLHYWRFNEPASSPLAYDYWGGDIATNHSAASGAVGPIPPPFTGFEATNGADAFDGFTSAVDTGLSVMNNFTQFSIIGWFNTAGTEPARTGLFGQNDVFEFGFHGVDASGEAQYGIFTAGGGSVFLPQTLITPGQWYFGAATGDGNSVNLYLFSTNGGGGFQVSQASTVAPTTNYGSSTFPFNIGGDGVLDPTGNYFTGNIDEVAMFNRALSVGELADLFGSSIGLASLAPQITAQPTPAAETLYSGKTVSYSVTVVGSPTLTYHWRTNGIVMSDGGNISGSSTATLTITNISSTNAGLNYDVVIANSAGSVTSSVVTFSVITAKPGSYEALTVSLNPIAYYRLNETNDPSSGTLVANDFVGGHAGVYAANASNYFDGVLGPVPPLFNFETNNGAVSFAAAPVISDWVTAPFGSLSTNNATMAMWIMPQGVSDQFAGLLMNRNSGVAGGFGFGGTAGAGQLGYTWNNNNANTYNFNSGLFPPANEWSFVALVVQPNQGIIYMMNAEGILAATNVVAHTADVFGNNWQIGRDNNSNANDGTRNFNGLIDEVAVFNYSLTQAQLTSLFGAGGGAVPVTLSIKSSGSNVVLSWPAGVLQQAPSVTGPWTTNNATSPFTNSTAGASTFYRVKVK